MKALYYGDEFDGSGTSIFLAGPTPRSGNVISWRPEALTHLEAWGFHGSVLVPEVRPGGLPPHDYEAMLQWREAVVRWEWRHLEAAGCILFWVPRDLATLPGFTTNVEFGFWVARNPKKVVFGCPYEAPKTRYLLALAGEHGVTRCSDLRATCNIAIHCARGGRGGAYDHL